MTFVNLKSTVIGVLILLAASIPTFAQQTVEFKAEAAAYVERAAAELAAEKNTIRRLSILRYLAPAAYRAERADQAAEFAKMLLTESQSVQSENARTVFINDAVNISNTVLGMIALDNGDIGGASSYLRASGRDVTDRGSPVLVSFGPMMILFKRVLDAGEKDAAFAYLDECARFWKFDQGSLAHIRAAAQKGEKPDWRWNLYTFDVWRQSSK